MFDLKVFIGVAVLVFFTDGLRDINDAIDEGRLTWRSGLDIAGSFGMVIIGIGYIFNL